MSLFSFFLFFISWLKFTLNSSRVSPTLSLVKSFVAFDVIRPRTPGWVLSSSGSPATIWSLQIGKQSASTSLSFGFGFGFIIIIHKSRLARIAIDRSLVSSCLSVPHSCGHLCRTIRRHQLKWQRVGNQIELEKLPPQTAPSEIEHNAKRWS